MTLLRDHVESMCAGIERVTERVPDLPQEEIKLSRLAMMAGNLIANDLERAMRPHGLNETEFRTLMMIFAAPDGRAYPAELCQFATQKPTNMTRIVDNLVRRGLVTRTHSTEDRRRIILQITDTGRRFGAEILPQLFPHVLALFNGFTAEERTQLDALLKKLIYNIDDHLPDQDIHA